MADKIKLLLVDDEKQFLETVSTRLGMRDFDVTTANSGEEAIEAARKKEFEIALVDLNMTGIGGEKVLEGRCLWLSGETMRTRNVTESVAGGLSETRPEQTQVQE